MILNVRVARAIRLQRRIATLVFAAVMSYAVAPTALSQTLASGADQLIKRYCTNDCVQRNEKLAVDSAGNGMAVWIESGDRLITARYYAGSGTWGNPVPLFSETAEDLQVGVDGGGNVLAVWSRYIGEGTSAIYFSRYMATNGAWGWTRPSTVIQHGDGLTIRDLVVGKNGDAMMLYRESYRPYDNFMRFDHATRTWAVSKNEFNLQHVRIALDDVGNAVAVFAYNPGWYYYGGSVVSAHRYNVASKQWEEGTILDLHEVKYDDYGNDVNGEAALRSLALSLDKSGNATAFWEKAVTKGTSTTRTIKTARFLKSRSAWLGKTMPVLSSGKTAGAALAADKYNNVNAVWVQYVGPYAKTVTARYSSTTGAWTKPRVLQTGNYHSRDADIKTDINGNSIATWSQRADGGTGSSSSAIFRTTAARYALGSNSWGPATTIQNAYRNGHLAYQGIDTKGRSLVMWTQQSGRVVNGVPVKEIRSDRLLPQ